MSAASFIVHYVYVLWLQCALLALNIDASFKFLIVFLGASLLSWLSARVCWHFPGFERRVRGSALRTEQARHNRVWQRSLFWSKNFRSVRRYPTG